jgi:EpsI family protein
MSRDSNIKDNSFLTSLVTLLVALFLSLAVSMRGTPHVVATNLEKLPMVINGMHGVDDYFPDAVGTLLNTDKDVYRHYRNPDGSQLDLYIGYYGTAKGGRTIHTPLICMPSQGWGLQEYREIKLKCRYYPDGVAVNYLLSSKGETNIVTIYWYQSSGTKVLSSGFKQNVQRFLDMVCRNRNDGAFVRVTLEADRGKVAEALKKAEAFSVQLLNLLPNYWPFEK